MVFIYTLRWIYVGEMYIVYDIYYCDGSGGLIAPISGEYMGAISGVCGGAIAGVDIGGIFGAWKKEYLVLE